MAVGFSIILGSGCSGGDDEDKNGEGDPSGMADAEDTDGLRVEGARRINIGFVEASPLENCGSKGSDEGGVSKE